MNTIGSIEDIRYVDIVSVEELKRIIIAIRDSDPVASGSLYFLLSIMAP